ncbi:hypothetical protein V6N11_055088 [Hibiscus sabdariffa]|uniref:Reverse transcriptase domain-containing protein n=1 Tax=Hibiscus sabdariffa TaxID=183260 RepID=A0ABR1ZPZ9_9ROSI
MAVVFAKPAWSEVSSFVLPRSRVENGRQASQMGLTSEGKKGPSKGFFLLIERKVPSMEFAFALVAQQKEVVSLLGLSGCSEPISLCNVLVKKISRILANRLREMLDELVGPHQSTFIKGRNIIENILLAHGLVRNFHRDKGTPKFCAKLDIRKAYDSVPWDAVLNTHP